MDCNSCGTKLATLGTALAIEIARGLSAEDINILGSLLNVIGDQLNLLAATAQSGVGSTQESASGKDCGVSSCTNPSGRQGIGGGGQPSSG